VFGLTEAAVMYVLLLRIDNRFKIRSAHAVTVISVAIFHISQGLFTQAVKNMINGCAIWVGGSIVVIVELTLRSVTFI
jgi:hypothetical protein